MIGDASRTTQINALLVQIESFDGVFVANTNLLGSFDWAAFRRFDLKIEFDYLKRGQRYGLLEATLAGMAGEEPAEPLSASHRRRLDRLDHLTPGDVDAICERGQCLAEQVRQAERLLGDGPQLLEDGGLRIGLVVLLVPDPRDRKQPDGAQLVELPVPVPMPARRTISFA